MGQTFLIPTDPASFFAQRPALAPGVQPLPQGLMLEPRCLGCGQHTEAQEVLRCGWRRAGRHGATWEQPLPLCLPCQDTRRAQRRADRVGHVAALALALGAALALSLGLRAEETLAMLAFVTGAGCGYLCARPVTRALARRALARPAPGQAPYREVALHYLRDPRVDEEGTFLALHIAHEGQAGRFARQNPQALREAQWTALAQGRAPERTS